MELEKVKDDLSKMEGELMKKILSCRANVLFVDKVTPPLINVQTRYGFSVRCCCNMALLTKNLMRSLRHY